MAQRNEEQAPKGFVDIDKGSVVIVDNERVFAARGRIPFERNFYFGRSESEMEDGESETTPEAEAAKGIVKGIASSTGKDAHGTEMSPGCLADMALQFTKGIDYLPTHPTWSNRIDWNHVIGRTISGTVSSGTVKNQQDMADPLILTVEVEIDKATELGMELLSRLSRKQRIGQSIGGYFTEMRFIYGEGKDPDYDWPDRIIVEKVELDHLAVTRTPSNGDSWIQGFRSAVSEMQARSRPPEPKAVVVVEATPEPQASEQENKNPTDQVLDNRSGTGQSQDNEEPNMDTALQNIQTMLTDLSKKVADLDARTAPKPTDTAPKPPEPVNPKVDEGEIAQLRARIVELENAPQRRGKASGNTVVMDTANLSAEDDSELMLRATEAGHSGLVQTVKELAGKDLRSASRGQLEGMLTELCSHYDSVVVN